MDSLVVPGLGTLRHWLDELGITFFECDNCQALHLPHMQNFDGVFDAKLDLVNDIMLFTAMAEVKPSALLALSADLSAINASSLTVKAFLDIQDDNLPKLVVCQSLCVGPGVTFEQFAWFMRQSEEQISMVIMEANAHQILFLATEGEEEVVVGDATRHFLH
ncbi:YbjN domain-containing protein [Kosakonia oryziphila]|uniref:Putative sensory transduction regulator n=1 Tax=Kosakonia oryziphila TaxID=1005667 RepID=A0A1C4FQU6_9ENTR|nr:YbjN domain-containing protein [Kosakonia oryziphila]SCC57975.1 Putative sensory transduction regulator [Kosakonia oryziphila]